MKKGNEAKDNFQEFLTHLEYLGYQIQYTGDKEDDRNVRES